MAKAEKIAPSACIGDVIEWQSIVLKEKKAIKRGKVLKLYENSVLVELRGHKRTVVANKRYKVIAKGRA